MLFALVLPLILMLSVIVVDVGNWYVHKRHLQTLVDAGAFAAGTEVLGLLVPVRKSPGRERCNPRHGARNMRVTRTRDPATKNLQVQEPAACTSLLNTQRVLGRPGDHDARVSAALDNTWDIDGSSAAGRPERSVRDERSLDVKATDAPCRFSGPCSFTPDAKTHARVEIRQVSGH